MQLGAVLAGAGRVAAGSRAQEDKLRRAQLDQLFVEEENRRRRTKATAKETLGVGPPPDLAGVFGATPEQMPIGPGAPRARQVFAKPSAAGAGLAPRYNKPPPAAAALTAGTLEGKGDLTREQFAALSPADQQKVFQTERAKLSEFNRQARGPRDEFGVQTPTGLQSRPVPKNIEEYAAGLRRSAGAGGSQRGVPTAARQASAAAVAGSSFEDVIPRLLNTEGGYNNRAADRGGETNFGISKAAHPDVDIPNLTAEQAVQIYKNDYWDAINADALPPQIREIAFDAAVNQGVGFAKQAVKASGGDPETLLQIREQRYRDLVKRDPTQLENFDGWMNRLERLAEGVGNAIISPASAADTIYPAAGVAPSPLATPPAPPGAPAPAALANAPVQQQASPAPLASPTAAVAGPVPPSMSKADFYRANPEAVSAHMQEALNQRAQLAQLANMYLNEESDQGMERYYMLKGQIDQIDHQLPMLAGMQGIQELSDAGDPRRLAQVWSHFAGMPINIQPQRDGTYSVFINNRQSPTKTNMTVEDLSEEARSSFDPEYVARKSASQQEANLLQFKSLLKRGEDTNLQSSAMLRELTTARAKGNIDAALKMLETQLNWKVQPLQDGSGSVLIKPIGSTTTYMLKPDGEEVEIDGVSTLSYSAKPVSGLATPEAR